MGGPREDARLATRAAYHHLEASVRYRNDLYDTHLSGERGWKKELLKATTKGNNGKCFEREEVIWFSPAYRKALESGRVPIRLSKQEKRNKKVNPER